MPCISIFRHGLFSRKEEERKKALFSFSSLLLRSALPSPPAASLPLRIFPLLQSSAGRSEEEALESSSPSRFRAGYMCGKERGGGGGDTIIPGKESGR